MRLITGQWVTIALVVACGLAACIAALSGKRTTLTIVGVALSPEYILASRGACLAFKSFGGLWMMQERLEAAFNMEGALNHVALYLGQRRPCAHLQGGSGGVGVVGCRYSPSRAS